MEKYWSWKAVCVYAVICVIIGVAIGAILNTLTLHTQTTILSRYGGDLKSLIRKALSTRASEYLRIVRDAQPL